MMNTNIIVTIRRISLLSVAGALLLPAIASAQQYYDPGLLHKTVDRKPADYLPPGARLGSFDLHGGAELAIENNDNIFYLDRLKISDNIWHIRPWANLNSNWNRHELNFNFYADLGRYSDYDGQDYDDWVASLNGRFDVKRGSSFNYKASYSELHEDRSSPDSGGIKPNEFAFSGFDLGYSHTFNRVTAALNYDVADTDYDDNIDFNGDILDNQDRDRSRDAWTLRFDYDLGGQRGVFVSGSVNNVDYDQQFDRNGFERSSDGYNVRGGMQWDMAGVLAGSVYLEYLSQTYDDARFSDISDWGVGADVEWTPTKLTNVSIVFKNAPQETAQVGTSGYYSSLYSARVQHELRRNLLLNVRYSYTNNDYGIPGSSTTFLTDTRVTRAGGGVSYLFNRNWYISGGYVFENQNANLDRYEYKTNRWFLTLGGEL